MVAVKAGYFQALRKWLEDVSVITYFLVMMFASCSWIVINGIWVELPLMVTRLPEGWALPSYLAIITQAANIAPLIYIIANKVFSNRIKDWPIIYVIIASTTIECFSLAFVWDRTEYVWGAEHSLALLILSGLLALVDCTACLIILPYMAIFKPQYMVALYIGQGMCGFIPGIIGLIQGLGFDDQCLNQTQITWNQTSDMNLSSTELVPVQQPPLFGVQTFFLLLFFMLVSSGVSFSFLNFHPVGKREMIRRPINDNESYPADESGNDHQKTGTNYGAMNASDKKEAEAEEQTESKMNQDDDQGCVTSELSMLEKVLLLIAVGWASAVINGVIPSVQSYSSLPYSNTVYSLSLRLASFANPLACTFAMFVHTRSVPVLLGLTLAASLATSYQIVLASTSPHPPLVGSTAGDALAICSAVLLMLLFSYVKVTAAVLLREGGRQALLWCGAITQLGSFLGAVVMFVLINVYHVFTAADTNTCSQIHSSVITADS